MKILQANHPTALACHFHAVTKGYKNFPQEESHAWTSFRELSNSLKVMKWSDINRNTNIYISVYVYTVVYIYIYTFIYRYIHTQTYMHTHAQILVLEIKQVWVNVSFKATGAGNRTGGTFLFSHSPPARHSPIIKPKGSASHDWEWQALCFGPLSRHTSNIQNNSARNIKKCYDEIILPAETKLVFYNVTPRSPVAT